MGVWGDASPHISVYSVYSVVFKIHWQCLRRQAPMGVALATAGCRGGVSPCKCAPAKRGNAPANVPSCAERGEMGLLENKCTSLFGEVHFVNGVGHLLCEGLGLFDVH